jgi:hypothetical protein
VVLLQTRLKEVEERMAQYAAEVELLRISRCGRGGRSGKAAGMY